MVTLAKIIFAAQTSITVILIWSSCSGRCWPNDSGHVDDEYSRQCQEVSANAKGLSHFENGLIFSTVVSLPQAINIA